MSTVFGFLVDDETRCVHYRGPKDIVAIRFKCCGRFYACYFCHAEREGHEALRWTPEEFDEPAVLCGACRRELPIALYLGSGFSCPSCASPFNPGCADHYHLYFDVEAAGTAG